MKARSGPARAPRGAPAQVRIIGGQWKRTPLPVLEAEGLRPTPDRVRETLFNWLNHLFDGDWEQRACLDLFAGTGALGFEAASRGARQVVLVENHGAAAARLEAARQKLRAEQVSVLRSDALAALRGLPAAGFDLVFLDPPYGQDWLPRVLPACAALLRPGGLVYAELEQALDPAAPPPWLAGWEVVRADKAGAVYYHLLRILA